MLADVNIVLILLDFELAFLEHVLLLLGFLINLLCHVLDVKSLRVVDGRLPLQLLLGALNFGLRLLIFGGQLLVALTGLGELDLDVAETVLKLLVLDLCQSQHLTALLFSALAAIDSEPLSGFVRETVAPL